MSLFTLVLFSLFITPQCFAESIEFFWGQENLKKINLRESPHLNGHKLELLSKDLYNPFRKSNRVYEGYDFFNLLDQVYGKRWRDADTITFTALDGFVQVAPVKSMLLKETAHSGIIAFREKNQSGFQSFEKNGKVVNPGPYYLVWTKFDGRSVAQYSDSLKWPYQLKSIKVLKVSKP